MQVEAPQLVVDIPDNTDFTFWNIPFGVFHLKTEEPTQARCASRIGDFVIDLAQLEADGHLASGAFAEVKHQVFNKPTLNHFMDLSRAEWKSVRETLQNLLKKGSALEGDLSKGADSKYLVTITDVNLLLPAQIGDYTDFYSSYNHAYNIGCMFRDPKNAVKNNWLWLPVGYHGRASSVVVSGTDLHRPIAQRGAPSAEKPSYGRCNRMDFELEVGTFIGNKGNKLGQPINVKDAENYIFGCTLMNDWSARDIQGWEYVPLGPFTGKSLGTVISPWVITLEALEPFKCSLPEPKIPFLDYLNDPNYGSYDLKLKAFIQLSGQTEEHQVCTSNYKYLYWSMPQQVTQHTVTGCNLKTGDLFGSGKQPRTRLN